MSMAINKVCKTPKVRLVLNLDSKINNLRIQNDHVLMWLERGCYEHCMCHSCKI